jgi:2,4-dienoyl-CoA reductase-like NADH-dependent reductase (Old Yellow Enzyme family)
MERMFKKFRLNGLELANRFVFPPVKTGLTNHMVKEA